MDKITEFTPATCREVGAVIEQAVNDALAPLGLTAKVGAGSYTRTGQFMPKLEVNVEGGAEREFASYASLVGLKPSDYGQTFTSQGRTLRIEGINLKAKKYPVEVVDVSDGKRFKFHDESVRVALGRPANRYDPANREDAA